MNKRTEQVGVKLSPTERAALKVRADAVGLGEGASVRELALSALNGEGDPRPVVTPLHDFVALCPMLGPPTGTAEDNVAVVTRAPAGRAHRLWVVVNTHLTEADARKRAIEARSAGFEADILICDGNAHARAVELCVDRNRRLPRRDYPGGA